MDASPPVLPIGESLEVINLKHYGIRAFDEIAIAFRWHKGNSIDVQYARFEQNAVYLWSHDHWLALDARRLDLSLFSHYIVLLPLPFDLTLEMLPALSGKVVLNTYRLRLQQS